MNTFDATPEPSDQQPTDHPLSDPPDHGLQRRRLLYRLLFAVAFGIVCSGCIYLAHRPSVGFIGNAAAAEQFRRSFAAESFIWTTLIGYAIASIPWYKIVNWLQKPRL